MKSHTSHFITVIIVLVVLALGAGIFAWSGLYNIAADDHHTKPVFAMLQTVRDNSIHQRSKDIQVPNLEDPQLILKGAGQYAAMCTGCHLAPGMEDSEIRPGLYPLPPELAKHQMEPQDTFWVIKHGIKMSGMPAWGSTHDDPTIWSMVAFLQKLPAMSPQAYADIVARAPPDEEMGEGGHHHGAAGDAGNDDAGHGDEAHDDEAHDDADRGDAPPAHEHAAGQADDGHAH